MTVKTLCPLCEEGYLEEQSGKNQVTYKGRSKELDYYYSVCDCCGVEQADARQVRNNKRLMSAFKKEVDGLLTGSQVRAIREYFKLTQQEAAKYFGGGPVAFSKYESDDVTQSESMDKLLRVASMNPSIVRFLSRASKVFQTPKSAHDDETFERVLLGNISGTMLTITCDSQIEKSKGFSEWHPLLNPYFGAFTQAESKVKKTKSYSQNGPWENCKAC